MKVLRVLVLVHKHLVPPEHASASDAEQAEWKTEYDVVTALQSVVARNVSALDAAVISVTQIHAGDAYNVIPDTAMLRGTFRALRMEVLEALKTRIEAIASPKLHRSHQHGRRPDRRQATARVRSILIDD